MLAIPEISDVDAAFPTKVPLPAWNDIPKEFRERWHRRDGFHGVVSRIFYEGGRWEDFGLKPKKGVDEAKARRAIITCLRSWEPQHEHKVAGVAYMLSEWFDLAH